MTTRHEIILRDTLLEIDYTISQLASDFIKGNKLPKTKLMMEILGGTGELVTLEDDSTFILYKELITKDKCVQGSQDRQDIVVNYCLEGFLGEETVRLEAKVSKRQHYENVWKGEYGSYRTPIGEPKIEEKRGDNFDYWFVTEARREN